MVSNRLRLCQRRRSQDPEQEDTDWAESTDQRTGPNAARKLRDKIRVADSASTVVEAESVLVITMACPSS
jgi:hypothetical protein